MLDTRNLQAKGLQNLKKVAKESFAVVGKIVICERMENKMKDVVESISGRRIVK